MRRAKSQAATAGSLRCGEWLLTAERVAIHLPSRTAVVADLHLGYDRVRQRGGEAVPVRVLAEELAPLLRAMRREGASRLVIAGDLFEDGRCQPEQMQAELREWLIGNEITPFGFVPGNHDRGAGEGAFPIFAEGVPLGEWSIVHGDKPMPKGRSVQGHEHPLMRWRRGVEGPCYLVAQGHVVLPAYSADAAGANVLGQARWGRYRCCAIAGEQVLDFGETRALGAQR